MKRTLFTIVLSAICTLSYSQEMASDAKVDEIAAKICEQAHRFENMENAAEFNFIYLEVARETGVIDELPAYQQQDAFSRSFYRIQRNCPVLLKLLNQISTASDWSTLTEKPKSTISNKDIKAFKERSEFYYRETEDARTDVFIIDGYWSDQFPDDTYTSLKMDWVNKTTFKLTFESSTNAGRDKLSNPGDEYFYELISKEEDYFLVSTWLEGQDRYQTFKMYYE